MMGRDVRNLTFLQRGNVSVQKEVGGFRPYEVFGADATSSLLGDGARDAVFQIWQRWPGELKVVDVKRYDEWLSQMTLVFTFQGGEFSKTVLSCCPHAHADEALRDAVQFFAAKKMEKGGQSSQASCSDLTDELGKHGLEEG